PSLTRRSSHLDTGTEHVEVPEIGAEHAETSAPQPRRRTRPRRRRSAPEPAAATEPAGTDAALAAGAAENERGPSPNGLEEVAPETLGPVGEADAGEPPRPYDNGQDVVAEAEAAAAKAAPRRTRRRKAPAPPEEADAQPELPEQEPAEFEQQKTAVPNEP